MTDTPLVLHVTTTDMSLELLLGPQLEAMAAAGYRVAGASGDGPYVAALEHRGIDHHVLVHSTRAMAPIRDALAFMELIRLLRQLRPAVLHTHNPKPGWYGRVAGRLARVPVVVNTVHGLYAAPNDRRAKRMVVYGLERVAAACSHAELVQNREDLEVLCSLRVPRDRLTLLGNGIDLRRFDPSSAERADVDAARSALGATDASDVVVGSVGRLVREKGYPELFEAASEVTELNPRVRFAVIGPDEPDKADAIDPADRARAAQAGVRLLGEQTDVERLYLGMDLFVLASHREGFPRAAMEASAMGVPIIATDIRGCREVVEPGVTGLLVPARDPGALARAIVELAEHPERRRAMGEAARAKARRDFDQQRCIDLTLATYERLLARVGRRRLGRGQT